jgi:DNA-directed RNA polymerase subunit omega
MLYPSLSELLDKVSSRYLLVNVIAHRAREISAKAGEDGEYLEQKPVSCAIEEIAAGEYKVS